MTRKCGFDNTTFAESRFVEDPGKNWKKYEGFITNSHINKDKTIKQVLQRRDFFK